MEKKTILKWIWGGQFKNDPNLIETGVTLYETSNLFKRDTKYTITFDKSNFIVNIYEIVEVEEYP